MLIHNPCADALSTFLSDFVSFPVNTAVIHAVSIVESLFFLYFSTVILTVSQVSQIRLFP